jgi:DHA1 family inner membrane transport protein
LAALVLGAFVVGSAELVPVGIVTLVADDLDVGIGTAGLLVSAYALGIAIGGPLLTAATLRVARRPLVLVALSLYAAATAVAVIAPTFGVLMIARGLTGALHGLFMGAALAMAAGLVPPERMGRAVAAVFGGIALATVLGVPLGTVVGRWLGWPATFAAVFALALVALAAAALAVPAIPGEDRGGFRSQSAHALASRVLVVLPVGFLIFGGQFSALTYITPFLEEVSGVTPGWVAVVLVGYGIANAVGNWLGGRAADRNVTATLVVINVVLIAVLGGLVLFGTSPVIALPLLIAWGLVGFAFIPAFQHRVVGLAGPGRDLASMLPPSAVTGGIAAGALVGGLVFDRSGAEGAFVAGWVITVAVLPLTVITARLR